MNQSASLPCINCSTPLGIKPRTLTVATPAPDHPAASLLISLCLVSLATLACMQLLELSLQPPLLHLPPLPILQVVALGSLSHRGFSGSLQTGQALLVINLVYFQFSTALTLVCNCIFV